MPMNRMKRVAAAIGAYAAHPDPRAAIANTVALVIVSNQPFYPLYLHWAVAPVVTIKAKTTDVTVAGLDQRHGYTFGIDNKSDRLIDIRHAGKCWCIDPSDEATDVVSRAIGALAAAHADIGTALTDNIGR